MRLWVDDERPMPPAFDQRTESSWGTIDLLAGELAAGRMVELISFDYDLDWPPHAATNDDTAQPILEWMCAAGFWPGELRFHTANQDGHEWMVDFARCHAPETTTIDETDIWL